MTSTNLPAEGFDWTGLLGGLGTGLAYTGGIAGALGSGGPQAMTNFVNKIAAKQNLELSQRWEGFQASQARSHQLLRDEAQRAHERGMQAESYRLKEGNLAARQKAALIASIGADPARRAAAANLLDKNKDWSNASPEQIVGAVETGGFLSAASNLIEQQVAGPGGLTGSMEVMKMHGGLNVDAAAQAFGAGGDTALNVITSARSFGADIAAEETAIDAFEGRLKIIMGNMGREGMTAEDNEQLVVQLDALRQEMDKWENGPNRVKNLIHEDRGNIIDTPNLPLGIRWNAAKSNMQAFSVAAESTRRAMRVHSAVNDYSQVLDMDPSGIASSSILDPANLSKAQLEDVLDAPPVMAVNQGMSNRTVLGTNWIITANILGIEHGLPEPQVKVLEKWKKIQDDSDGQIGVEDIVREAYEWRASGDKPLAGATFGSLEETVKFLSDLRSVPSDKQLLAKTKMANSKKKATDDRKLFTSKIFNQRSAGYPVDQSEMPGAGESVGLSTEEVASGTAYPASDTLNPKEDKFHQEKFDPNAFWTYHESKVEDWVAYFKNEVEKKHRIEVGEQPVPPDVMIHTVENWISAVGGNQGVGASGELTPDLGAGFREKLFDAFNSPTQSVGPSDRMLGRLQAAMQSQPTVLRKGLDEDHTETVIREEILNRPLNLQPPTYGAMVGAARGSEAKGVEMPLQVGDLVQLGQASAEFRRITGGANASDSMPNNSVAEMQSLLRLPLSKKGYFEDWKGGPPNPFVFGFLGHTYHNKSEVEAGWSAQQAPRFALDAFMHIDVTEVEDRESAAQIQLIQNWFRNADRGFVEPALFGATEIPVREDKTVGEVGVGWGERKAIGMTVPHYSDIGIPLEAIMGSREDYANQREAWEPIDPGRGEAGTPTSNVALNPNAIAAHKRALEIERDNNVSAIKWGVGSSPGGEKPITQADVLAEEAEYTEAIAQLDALYTVVTQNKTATNKALVTLRDIFTGPDGNSMVNFDPSDPEEVGHTAEGRSGQVRVSDGKASFSLKNRLKKAEEEGGLPSNVFLALLNLGAMEGGMQRMIGGGEGSIAPYSLERVLGTDDSPVDAISGTWAIMDLLIESYATPGAQGTTAERAAIGRYLSLYIGQLKEEVMELTTTPELGTWELADFKPGVRRRLEHVWESLNYAATGTLPGSGDYSGDDSDEVDLSLFNKALAITWARLSNRLDSVEDK